jgi:high-affinity nickel-transport protein
MDAATALSSLALGFGLGVTHALDADHMVAVATIVSERPSTRRAAAVGAMWGLGHGAALSLVGIAMVVFRWAMPAWLAGWFELVVAAMLVGLGVQAIRRGLRPSAHVHVHTHDGTAHVHRHVHLHGHGDVHGEHDGALHALAHAGRRPFVVGVAHGLAGSAALTLLVVGTIGSPAAGVAYLAIFGLGAVAGMTLLSALLSLSMVFAGAAAGRLHRRLEVAIGAGGIAFGVVLAMRVLDSGALS